MPDVQNLVGGAAPDILVLVSVDGVTISGNGSSEHPLRVINNAPSPSQVQVVYVSKGGNDATGTGAFFAPFLTIQRALTSITDATTDKRYAIMVGPGAFADPFQIKPWTSVIGVGAGSNGVTPDGFGITEVSAPADTCGFDASWATSGFSVAWYANIGFVNAQTWAEPAGSQPQLNFFQCSFNALSTYTGPGTSGTDNVTWYSCISYGGITVSGWSFLWTQRCTFLGGTITIESPPAGAVESTKWLSENTAVGAGIDPTDVTLLWAAPSPAGALASATLENTSINGTLTLNGAHTSFAATVGGVPPAVVLLNGASAPVLETGSNSLGYTPGTPANWVGPAPTSVQQALDRIAALLDAHFGAIP